MNEVRNKEMEENMKKVRNYGCKRTLPLIRVRNNEQGKNKMEENMNEVRE